MRSAAAADCCWISSNFDQLILETWDDETFAFNPASGHTHLLNSAALTLLQELATQAQTNAMLVERFLSDQPEAQRQAMSQQLIQQLIQLEMIGLIEQVDSCA